MRFFRLIRWLGWLGLWSLLPLITLAQNPLDAARQAIEQAETAPERATALVQYAELLIENAAFEDALTALDEASQLVQLPTALDVFPEELLDTDLNRAILWYRGFAAESLGRFVEARNDYVMVLALAPESDLADQVRARMAPIDAQATRALAQLALTDEAQLARFYQYERNPYTIGVLPFFNQSESVTLTRVGYGLAGFLTNVLALLESFTDQPFQMVERTRLSVALDEVTLGRFYAADAPLAPPQIGQILGAEFMITGTLATDGMDLIAETTLGLASQDRALPPKTETGALSDQGLQVLQRTLALDLADRLQRVTGFNYVPSRTAFADSVSRLYIDDVQRFVAYGHGLQLALAGDYDEAERIFSDANLNLDELNRLSAGLTHLSSLNQNGNSVPAPRNTTTSALLVEIGLSALGDAAVTNQEAGVLSNGAESSTETTNNPTQGIPATQDPAKQILIKIPIKIPLPIKSDGN